MKVDLLDLGLTLREEKCEAFSLEGISDLAVPVPVRKDCIDILGSPFGSDDFVQRACLLKVKKVEAFFNRLPLLEDCQVANLLLRSCANPKINHLFRTVAPELVEDAAVKFDGMVVSAFEAIVGCKLGSVQPQQLFLSVKNGGFGFQRCEEVVPCAFVGSWASTVCNLPDRDNLLRQYFPPPVGTSKVRFVEDEIRTCLSQLNKNVDRDDQECAQFENLVDFPSKQQAKLRKKQQSKIFQDFISSVDKNDRARVLSGGGISSGSWLFALPSTHALTMNSAQFRLSTFLRLGANLPVLEGMNIFMCSSVWQKD